MYCKSELRITYGYLYACLFKLSIKGKQEYQGWQKSGKYEYFPGRQEILGNKIDS
jgi:hypothetical protein